MTDLSQATIDELRALQTEIAVEIQERSIEQNLLDQAWNLVTSAKNAGYTMPQVAGALTNVVTQAYA